MIMKLSEKITYRAPFQKADSRGSEAFLIENVSAPRRWTTRFSHGKQWTTHSMTYACLGHGLLPQNIRKTSRLN